MPFLMILIVGMRKTNDIEELKELGAKVKALRIKRNSTQLELAEKCGLDRNYIGMLERGERNPSYLTLQKIAQGLCVSLTKLLNYKE